MFEQAKLKARWAGHILRQLSEGVIRFHLTQSNKVFAEHNTETGELRLRLSSKPDPVRPDVVMLTGTCIQTMLSCFDYVTSEIVNSAKGTDTRVHFPIDVNDDQLKASGSYKKIARLNPPLADFILTEIRPTKADNFLIWALKRLPNTDKHRNILLVSNWHGFEVNNIERSDGIRLAKQRFTAPAGSHHDVHFAVSNVTKYDEPKAIVQVTIDEPDLRDSDRFYRREVVETLSNFLQVTTKTITAIEEFLTSSGK